MKNFIQKGCSVTVTTPTGGAVSGDGVLIGSLFGIAAYTSPAGAPLEIQTEGVFDLPKDSGVAFSTGAKAYWDAPNKALTGTASGNAWVGVVTQGALSSDATARVRLNHMPIT